MQKIIKIILMSALVILPVLGLAQTGVLVRDPGGIKPKIVLDQTKEASDISITADLQKASANLWGYAPNPAPDEVGYFRYAATAGKPPVFCEDFYGSAQVYTTPDQPLGGTNDLFKVTVANLEPGTEYSYCAIRSKKTSGGAPCKEQCITYGNIMPFNTPNYLEVKTAQPTGVGQTTATLNGSYKTDLDSGEVWFQWYQGSIADNLPFSNLTGAISTSKPGTNYSFTLTGLEPHTTYTYRAWGKGTANSSTPGLSVTVFPNPAIQGNPQAVQFTTGGPTTLPSSNFIKTKLASGISTGIAYLNGVYLGPDTDWSSVWFEWSSNQSGPFSLTPFQPPPSSTIQNILGGGTPFTQKIIGVGLNQVYYFRAAGQKINGTVHKGAIISFNSAGANQVPYTPGQGCTFPCIELGPIVDLTPGFPIGPVITPGGGFAPQPPSFSDAIVRQSEGVEHVFARQIRNNPALASLYGYQVGMNLTLFANDTAHFLAIAFGYVNGNGREIRVAVPDRAAYEIKIQTDNSTIIKEYFDYVLIDTRTLSYVFKTPKQNYEYYYKR